jgi:hypothetical protein|eukprot:3524781-Prymnesium_polylepis.1
MPHSTDPPPWLEQVLRSSEQGEAAVGKFYYHARLILEPTATPDSGPINGSTAVMVTGEPHFPRLLLMFARDSCCGLRMSGTATE